MARTRLYPPSVDPGFPRLPETPKGWTRTTFGAVLEAVERPSKLDGDATYQLVTAKRSRGGIVSRGTLLGREILTKTQFQAKEGDFLISRRQIIHGACGVVPPELDGAVVSNEYSTLRTRPGLLMDFLRHLSHTPYFQRTCFHASHGVDVEKMIFKLDEWLGARVDLPPVREQKKIAAILSSIDDVVGSTRAVIEQLQTARAAMTAELLTRGVPGRHADYVATEVGQIPAKWECVKLKDVNRRMFVGIAQAATHAYVTDGGVPIIRTTNVRANKLVTGEVLHISEAFAAEMRSKSLNAGDVLSARTGNPGVSVVVPSEYEGAQCFSLLVSRPGARLLPQFLCHLMNSSLGTAIVSSGQAGGAQQNLNVGVFQEAKIPLPPLEEQRELSRLIDALYAREVAEAEFLAGLSSLKSALLTALLTGEVRVPLTPETP